MGRDLQAILRKLDRPPAGPNWVRFVHDEPERTAKAILSFAKGIPPFTYRSGYVAAKDRIELGIDKATALGIAQTRGAPAGRAQNAEFIEAFFEYDAERRYSAANSIDFEGGRFLVSREVWVPVSPLSVIREHGVFLPVFVCGWNTNPLSLTQRRLYATLQEDAFLSLTDFLKSPSETLFFPKVDIHGQKKRVPEVWRRGDYELLSKSELDRCVEVFLVARDAARAVLIEEITEQEERRRHESERGEPEPLSTDDLFYKK